MKSSFDDRLTVIDYQVIGEPFRAYWHCESCGHSESVPVENTAPGQYSWTTPGYCSKCGEALRYHVGGTRPKEVIPRLTDQKVRL